MLSITKSFSYRSILSTAFAIAIPFLFAATAKAEQNFIAYLDGQQAQTNSAGKGFVAIAYRENGQTSFKAKWTGTSPGTSFAVYTDQGTWMFDIALNGTFATVGVSEYISPERLELLKQGRVRFIVRTQTHPMGEIAGSSQPYSAYVGRIGGANVTGGHPTAVGLGAVFLNKDETDAIFYLKYAGFEQNVVSVIVDQRTVIGGWANASGIVMDVYSSYGPFTDAVKERLRRGTFVMAVSQNFLTARGMMRPVNRVVDFNGDNRSDLSVYRPSEGMFYWKNSATGQSNSLQWGNSEMVPVPADFDGDGLTDFAVWLPSNGYFYVRDASTMEIRTSQWGKAGDIPIPADYDGDGRSDYALYRPGVNNTQSYFWIKKSSGGHYAVPFGLGNDKPITADFDGDRRADVAVFRPSEGKFYAIRSRDGSLLAMQWGISTDTPFAADYDGDGLADIGVYRSSDRSWWIATSSTGYGSYIYKKFGLWNPEVQPADFNGDGFADIGYFRNGIWAYLRSDTGTEISDVYGLIGDKPLAGN